MFEYCTLFSTTGRISSGEKPDLLASPPTLTTQYRPAIHSRYKYDGRRVVLRHKAFKTLLRQYNPDVYRLIDHQYLELHKGLEAIFRTATLGIHKYQEDFARLYILHQERTANPVLPDIRELRQLEAEMEEAAYAL